MPSAFFVMPIIIALSTIIAVYYRGKAYMKFFQQEEYDGKRFLTWVRCNAAIDRVATLIIVISLLAGLSNKPLGAGQFTTIIAMVVSIFLSLNAIKQSKKALVMTARAKRILVMFMVLGIIFYIGLNISLHNYHQSMDFNSVILALPAIMLLSSPLILVTAKILLDPHENRVQRKFRQEAELKLSKLNPTVIAMTGSFGKTSTKHILYHILSASQPTLATPGSVNTIMGITRVIREQLTPDHKYFIVEMGAYGKGSIKRLCEFTPPDLGLITSIGAAHFERFKSLENVAEAKFELAEDVFSRHGQMIINANGIDKNLLDSRMQEISGDYYVVGGAEGQLTLGNVTLNKSGMSLDINIKGEESQSLQVPLYGHHQADNILSAVATARKLGLPWSVIKAAMRTIPQIKHRTEVSQQPGQITTINDAYNSNPLGFEAALNVLDNLKSSNGRRILVTPGMVELGDRHDEAHYKIGKKAATLSDIVLVVTPERIPSFVEGVEEGNGADLLFFSTQDEAETWLKSNAVPDDVILFENNLPDLYESRVFF